MCYETFLIFPPARPVKCRRFLRQNAMFVRKHSLSGSFLNEEIFEYNFNIYHGRIMCYQTKRSDTRYVIQIVQFFLLTLRNICFYQFFTDSMFFNLSISQASYRPLGWISRGVRRPCTSSQMFVHVFIHLCRPILKFPISSYRGCLYRSKEGRPFFSEN